MTRIGAECGVLLTLLTMAAAPGQARPVSAAKAPRVETVTLSIRHRVFHDFHDLQSVRIGQKFLLGDTDYDARVVQYVPDFEMDLASRKVVSRSGQPNNPAFRIIVRKGDVPQDTAWAFLNMPPHFGRRSYFAFHVVRIDFSGHAPMVADTVAISAPAPSNAAAPSSSGSHTSAQSATPSGSTPAPGRTAPPPAGQDTGLAPAHRDTTGR
jgi:hypothetical protein